MASSVLDIYNAALSAARAKGRLASLTDRSRGREECDIWYPIVRKQVQEGAFWPACRQSARLSLVANRTATADWVEADPEPQYLYTYALPANYLRAWHLASYARFNIGFRPETDENVLYTNQKDPVLLYAAEAENPVHWNASLVSAIIHALAASIVGPMSGDLRLQQTQFNLANDILIQAQTEAANSIQPHLEHVPETLRDRGYSDTQDSIFLYPFGSLFTAAITNV